MDVLIADRISGFRSCRPYKMTMFSDAVSGARFGATPGNRMTIEPLKAPSINDPAGAKRPFDAPERLWKLTSPWTISALAIPTWHFAAASDRRVED
jgi:hypothetical protein